MYLYAGMILGKYDLDIDKIHHTEVPIFRYLNHNEIETI